ncbi:hypothetical protein [Flavivirga eckloniae]|uniref:Beta-carotene 15,15'-monooxygenase n=1 Tax=Flavivirga eckloniae TaxID=1803846 RepID=A0A2K9PM33_9FLAO|nr:hypothetical protein [Flavivirga eckloniae]AUP78124.1 hypothetical protein C1H87_05085 [Flavivirga eckloniae]
MDELDLLKKDWNKDNDNYPKLTYDEIYKMILKKSSSIVKWIFIISLLEFGFWTIISLLLKDAEGVKNFEQLNNNAFFIALIVIGYVVLALFFYLFFRNYRRISTTDSAKVLMENILKTRKTVKQYVAFNLIYLIIGTIFGVFIELGQDQLVIDQIEQATANGEIFKFYAVFIISAVLLLAVCIGMLLLFYWLVYGILLKRLNHNYKELKKLEI